MDAAIDIWTNACNGPDVVHQAALQHTVVDPWMLVVPNQEVVSAVHPRKFGSGFVGILDVVLLDQSSAHSVKHGIGDKVAQVAFLLVAALYFKVVCRDTQNFLAS